MYYAKPLVKFMESVQSKTIGKIQIIDGQNIGSIKKLAASKIGSRKVEERIILATEKRHLRHNKADIINWQQMNI